MRARRLHWALCVLSPWLLAPDLPQAEHGALLMRRLSAPYERAWAAVREVAEEQGEVILLADEAAGVLTFSLPGVDQAPPGHFNVVLVPDPAREETLVYASPRAPLWTRYAGPDAAFFEALARKLGGADVPAP